MIAITHLPSPQMAHGLRTYLPPVTIDLAEVGRQHRGFSQMLEECGAQVIQLDVNAEYPDCVFIEDTAIVLDEVAIVASMGAPQRRGETAAVADVLRCHRELAQIHWPAKIEGGDVLRVGRTLLVGLSQRTNQAGADALAAIAVPLRYRVRPVPVRSCLHLKTACCALDERRLLVNPDWIDSSALEGFELICVPAEEPWAASILPLGEQICLADAHRRTADMLTDLRCQLRTVPLSELAKAEGGITCLALIVGDP